MKLKDFDKLTKQDFANGAVIDEIRSVFKARDKLLAACRTVLNEWFDEFYPPDIFTGVSGDDGVEQVIRMRRILRAAIGD